MLHQYFCDIAAVTVFQETDADDPFSECRNELEDVKAEITEKSISDVTVVGAVCYGRDMSILDTSRTMDALQAALKLGFDVRKNFKVTALNLLNDQKNGDFLKSARAAHLVVISYVPKDWAYHLYQGEHGAHDVQLSDLRLSPRAWPEKADQLGAKMVATYGSSDEVDADYFERGGYYKRINDSGLEISEYVIHRRNILLHRSILNTLSI